MESKTPVLLCVLVETPRLRWFVAAIALDGTSAPLLCSEVGDLEKYPGLDFDEQVAFLRHRFCGVLQRGCDRIWARQWKACAFVFVFDGLLPEPTGQLTQVTAEHFAQWMLNPPVVVFNRSGEFLSHERPRLHKLAGDLDPALTELLLAHLGQLLTTRENQGAWELARKKVG